MVVDHEQRQEAAFSGLLDLMGRVGTDVHNWWPPGQRGLTFGQETIAALYFGCVGFYRGVLVLLRERLVPEAEALARTLMYDTATLVFLKGQEKRLEEFAMRFVCTSMRYESRYYSQMKNQGWPGADENMSHVTKEMGRLLKQAKSMGIHPLEPFPTPDQILAEMRQTQGKVLIERAHHAVHTSRFSLGSRIRQVEEGRLSFTFQGTAEDGLRVAGPVIDLFLAASEAAAGLLKWKTAWRISKLRRDTVHKAAGFMRKGRPEAASELRQQLSRRGQERAGLARKQDLP